MTSEIGADSARSRSQDDLLPCCWEVGTSHCCPAFGWVNVKLEEDSPAGLTLPYWEVFSCLGKRGGWGGAVLDSGHCWRGAPQPRGLSPAMGPGPAAPATTPWHRQRCFQLLGSERGCTLEDAPAPAALIHWLLHQSRGKHRGHLERWDAQQLPPTSSHHFAQLFFQ